MALEMQAVTVPRDVARIILCEKHEKTVVHLSEGFGLAQLRCKHCGKPMSEKFQLTFDEWHRPRAL